MSKNATWRTLDRIKVGQHLYGTGLWMAEIKAVLSAMPGSSMVNVKNSDLQRFFADEDVGDRVEAESSRQAPVVVAYRDILMQVGPDFPASNIAKAWPDTLIADVNRWRTRRNMPPVQVVGP